MKTYLTHLCFATALIFDAKKELYLLSVLNNSKSTKADIKTAENYLDKASCLLNNLIRENFFDIKEPE